MLARLLLPRLRWHVLSLLCLTTGGMAGAVIPLTFKWTIDQVIPRKDEGHLVLAVGLIFIGYSLRTGLYSLGGFLMGTTAQASGLSLKMDLLRHLDALSPAYYENTPVGSLVYVLKEPVDEVAGFGADLLPLLWRMVSTAIVTLTAMSFLSPALTLLALPFLAIFLISRQRFRLRLARASDDVQGRQKAWTEFLEEHLSNVTAIQILGQQRRQERRAFGILKQALGSQRVQMKIGLWFTSCSASSFILATCFVIACGGRLALGGSLSTGTLVAFYSFVAQLFEPLSGASELYVRTQKIFASIRQLESTFAARPEVKDAISPIAISGSASYRIQFTQVTFAYRRREYSLSVPSLEFLDGEAVGITGENGAGKSTLAKLIARFYDPLQGTIRIGGNDLRNLALSDLRRCVLYLSHQPILFQGTLESNLRFVRPDASRKELESAVRLAGLEEFVAALPGGLQHPVGPEGCQLSGGQRQRLALTRALLLRPRILVLDEAMSSLDPRAEAFVLRNIRNTLPQTTLIVISHRHSTVTCMGRVIIVSGGQITADGITSNSFPVAAISPTFHC